MELFYTITVYVLAGLLGMCFGSFLNVVIYRVPLELRLSKPGSACPKCGHALRWYENIPLFSYLFLGGKCSSCGAPISFRYFAVELTNTLLWLLSVALFWDKSILFAIITAIASSVLICVFCIDLEHKLVFDRFVLILGLIAIPSLFFDPYYDWLSHLLGGIIGFVSFFGIAFLYYKIKGKEGLGGGDVKLTAACGLLLGWQRLLLAVLVASIAAGIILSVLVYKKRKNSADGEGNGEYPFAPFLSTAFVFVLFVGNYIISAYFSLLGL